MKLALKINCGQFIKKTISNITSVKKSKLKKNKKRKTIILTEVQKEAKKEKIAAKRKIKLNKSALKIVQSLVTIYPKTFTLNEPKKPLKVNILEDILDTKICKKNVLVKALQLYCHKNYTKNLLIGADRYDLSGKAVSKVTEKEFERKFQTRGFKTSC